MGYHILLYAYVDSLFVAASPTQKLRMKQLAFVLFTLDSQSRNLCSRKHHAFYGMF